MKIPYFDVSRQHQSFSKNAIASFKKVLNSGAYILGPELKAFEAAFSSYVGTKYALGVGSGTDALIFSLLSLGIKKGDEVIVPSFTFTSTALAVTHIGAIPVFVDVEETSFNLNPDSVKKAISKKTKAILVVHLFGQCANMTAILNIAKEYGLKVVEDACQAHGSTWKNKQAGSFGDAGAFSFYPTKNLGGVGDGGAVTTSNANIQKKCLQYRNLGKGIENPMVHDEIGWTSRLDSIQATFLNLKLKQLDGINQNRREIADIYHKELKTTPLGLPYETPGAYHVYHIYVVRVPQGKRDALKEYLASKNIPSMIHYKTVVDEQPVMKRFKTRKVDLSTTRKLQQEVLTLPLFPYMKKAEMLFITSAIKQFYKK